jgi:hypothetical protein
MIVTRGWKFVVLQLFTPLVFWKQPGEKGAEKWLLFGIMVIFPRNKQLCVVPLKNTKHSPVP